MLPLEQAYRRTSLMLRINAHIAIPEAELSEHFVRASGPGGQKVNKVSTAVELRFDVRRSPSLPDDVRARLERLAGRRLTSQGILVIRAERFRTQERNRADARARLAALVRRATVAPKPRVKTKPSRAAKARRLDTKTRRGRLKQTRRVKPDTE
jgi:ribosome-associated protein